MLELLGSALFCKSMIADQLPWFVSGRVHRTAGIVDCDAFLQIRGETNISLFGKRLAPNEIDVKHLARLEPVLLRQGYGGQPSL